MSHLNGIIFDETDDVLVADRFASAYGANQTIFSIELMG